MTDIQVPGTPGPSSTTGAPIQAPGTPGSVSTNGLAQVTQMHQLNQNTELILGANPWLANDLNTLQRLASSGAPPIDLVNNAAALAGVESIDTMAQALSTLTPVGQRAAYSKMTEQQQRALAQMGYMPPQAQSGEPGVIGQAFSVAGDIIDPIMSPVATVLGPSAGMAFNTLAWVGDVPAHFYRGIRQMDGWEQWVATGAMAAGMIALPVLAPGLIAGAGTLGTIGAFGAAGLGAATASTAVTNITNPSEWWDVFNPWGSTGVGRGERIFDAKSQRNARELLGGAEHLDALARDIAANLDVYDLATEFAGQRGGSDQNAMLQSIERVAAGMADVNTPEFQTLYEGLLTLAQQPEFQQAVDELQGGKISFGRDVAGAFGMERGDSMYNVVSGGIDALWLVTLDPTMALGKVGMLTRLGRRGGRVLDGGPAGTGRIVRMLDEDPIVARSFDEVAAAIDGEDFNRLPKAWASTYDDLVRYKRQANPETFDRTHIAEFMAEQGGISQVMAGKATVRGSEQVRLSTQTRTDGWGGFVESVRRFQRGMTDEVLERSLRDEAERRGATVDLDDLLPQNAMDDYAEDIFVRLDDLNDPVAASSAYALGQRAGITMAFVPGGRSFANFVGSISTMTPGGSSISLVGDAAATDIPRFVESFGRHMNVPGRVRDEWIREVMRAGSVGQRRQLLKSYMDTGFTAVGMRATDEMATVVDDLLTKYDQAYALGGVDDVRIDDIDVALGVFPDLHHQASIIVPELAELSRIVRKGHILKHVAKVSDHSFVEQSMSRVVKPSWLLRIGFIPRAAGEEMLAFWMRASETSLMAEAGARSIGQGRAFQAARRELAQNGNKVDELSTEMQEALRFGVATHLRPLIAAGRRFGWDPPQHMILENYTDWMRNSLESGIGWQWHETMPTWAQQIALGKRNSWRRVIVGGVDEALIDAGTAWAGLHRGSVMAAVSSNESSNFDTRLLKRDSSTVHLPDPRRPGHFNEVKVTLAEDGSVGTTDIKHRAGIHHRIQEPFMDDVVREPLVDALSSYKPETVNMSRADLADLVDMVPAEQLPSRMILQSLLDPRDDAFKALADTMKDDFPEVAGALRNARRHRDLTVDDIVDELRHAADEAESRSATLLQKARDKGVKKETPVAVERKNTAALTLRSVADEIEASAPGLERLTELDGDDATWATMQVSRHLASRVDTSQLRRPDGWVNRPPVVYYRDPDAYGSYRINDDGSLTLVTGDPIIPGDGRSLRMATIADRDKALIEIDGTFIHGEYSTNLDALRHEARAAGDSNAALIGDDDKPFTEIELYLDDGEVNIPAGRWRFDELEQEGLTHVNGWSPMYESFDDMRAGLIEELTRRMSAPDFDRTALSSTIASAADGPLARAVPDDVMRAYTPVVDRNTERVIGMLDSAQVEIPEPIVAQLHELATMTRSVDAPFDPAQVGNILEALVAQTDAASPLGVTARRVSQQFSAGELDAVDAVAELVDAAKTPSNLAGIADELLSSAENATAWNASVAELTDLERRKIIEVALEEIARNRAIQGQPTVTALESLAFDDPNIATWVSRILSDSVEPGSRQAALLDLPLTLADDAPTGAPAGVESLTKTKSGRVLRVDDRYAGQGDVIDTTRIERVDRNMFDPFDGTNTVGPEWRVGESLDSAIRQYAERIADHTLNSQRRMVDNELTNEIMWGAVGPMVRDSLEDSAGMSLFAKSRNGGENAVTRARVWDLNSEPSATTVANVDIVSDQWRNDGMWDRIVRFGWGKVIGPSIDALAREPMAFHHFQRAFTENRRNLHWLLDSDLFTKRIPEAFPEIARLDEIGNVDDLAPAIRKVADAWSPSGADLSDVDANTLLATVFDDQADMDDALAYLRTRHADDPAMLNDIDAIADLNYEAVAFGRSETGVLGSDSAAERFVMRYHRELDDDAWMSTGSLRSALRDADAKLGPANLNDDQINALFEAHSSLAKALDTATENAGRRAIENMIPFLDSHSQRSMFSTYARNYIPFWYAEENFLKRWARTLALTETGGLDSVRKAQLTYMGLRSASIVRTDANGEDWVVYPGSGLLTEAVAKILPGDSAPVGVLFQARTESLLPGVNSDFGGVSASPFVAMPVHFTSQLFPDSADAKRALLGDVGASSNPLSQFVPAVVGRTFTALFQDEDSSERYASAMMTAMAYAEASDQGLPGNASPAQVDEYLDRMKNHARIILLTQAIGGFVSPGSPQPIVTGQDATSLSSLAGIGIDDPRSIVSDPYRELVGNLGIEEGTARFLELNPTADLEDIVNPLALVASQSESISGAPLPATEHGIGWYNDNADWVNQSPDAGAWFVPQDPAGSEFDYYSYSQQFASGLRKQKSPEEFLRSVKFRAGAEVYFSASDSKEEALERASRLEDSAAATREVNDKWDIWRTSFLAANPIFAEELTSTDARNRRARTIDQMRYAINDPSAPDSPYNTGIREMVNAYDQFTAQRTLLKDKRDATSRDTKRRLNAAFENWATGWQLRYPSLARLWVSTYGPAAQL